MAGYLRELRGITPLEPTEADIRRMYQRAEEWDLCPVTRERMLEINHQTQRFYEQQYRNSWSQAYLTHRFGIDLAGHEDVRPGHAPAGWTNLVDHLRQDGVSDAEMLATGVATRARTGRLIDRFRDRVTFPILTGGTGGTGGTGAADGPEILGFVARRHPDATDTDTSGPKYLNTPTTPLFHKGAQLYGLPATTGTEPIPLEAVPVVVEGPMDAVAVTLASAGRYLGVAPLGTALTDEQASHLVRTGRHPVIATDADIPGQHAAERAFWLLTPHGLDPGYADLPPGHDPASLLTNKGPAALVAALESHGSLGHELLTRSLAHQPVPDALFLTQIVAALPSSTWHNGASRIAAQVGQPEAQIRVVLLGAVKAWDDDP
ncbi:MAG: toprim domain-containing protein, partial [Herbiconiux sp.]|nr:toprim domain-containing protein [Herbiconiux sp.]